MDTPQKPSKTTPLIHPSNLGLGFALVKVLQEVRKDPRTEVGLLLSRPLRGRGGQMFMASSHYGVPHQGNESAGLKAPSFSSTTAQLASNVDSPSVETK